MNALETLVSETLAAPLAAARAHAEAGGRVIGLCGAQIPAELVLAAGAFPLQLDGLPPRATPEADAYLESSFAPPARLMLQAWLEGALDFLDAIVLTRASDNSQRLYYYACELRRAGRLAGPEPLLYDLAKIERASSAEHSRKATAMLAARLGAGDGAAGLRRMDRRRALFARLAAARHCWPGAMVERLTRAAGLADFDRFDAALAEALETAPPPIAGPRLLLAGTAPPDDRLHRAVAEAGGNILAELHEFTPDRHGAPLGDSADPLAAIAQRQVATALGSRCFADRPAQTLALAERHGAQGVIFWLIEEEEALVWDLPGQIRAAESAGLAPLVLTRAAWQAPAPVLARIATFTAQLGARA